MSDQIDIVTPPCGDFPGTMHITAEGVPVLLRSDRPGLIAVWKGRVFIHYLEKTPSNSWVKRRVHMFAEAVRKYDGRKARAKTSSARRPRVTKKGARDHV